MDATAHHYAVTVSDLERAVEFYHGVLDLEVRSRFSVGGDAFAAGVGIEGASADFAHLDAGGVRLELVEYAPEGEARPEGALNQSGATHLGLEVEDLDAVYEELPDDIETLSEPQTTESGTRICFLRDPEGTLVELLET
ncbi:VOC family protein [Haloarcula amylovorans]|uniref:VOC family protein n=1 Tax=Haloarcula amylovorans TaxID=2562280 RepID=UPI001076526C|nr:VOC family protein [Halomicroarcula amylolytica]